MRAYILRAIGLSAVTLVGLGMAGCKGQISSLPTTPDPVIVTENFDGVVNINGAVTHTFFTSATGTVTATLTGLGDTPPSKIGFSMGTYSGSTCTVVLRNDNAVATSVIQGTVTTLAGSLCISVYDVGALTAPVSYTVTVVHP
jgi:hypothetical protein